MIGLCKLENIMLDCLFKEEELVDGKSIVEPIVANGILNDFGFHPARLENHREDVQEMINQLHVEFKNGWSFLNLCVDQDGNHWGEHVDCEKLTVLAIALGLAEYKLPKEYWHALPGNMPYISFKFSDEQQQ